MSVIFGAVMIGIFVHNFTGIQAARAAAAAASEGADGITAAAAAGPADTQTNWIITWATGAMGVISMLTALWESWKKTSGQSVVDRIKNLTSPDPTAEETSEVLLAKLKKALQRETTTKLTAAVSSITEG